jgi:ribA/ribD-fused uncharacterized protein
MDGDKDTPRLDEVASSVDARHGVIKFYDPTAAFGWLSTFSNHPITLDGIQWPTVEHFFQAAKFPRSQYRTLIKEAHWPADAKDLAAEWRAVRRPDWNMVEEQVMQRALIAKFEQHPELLELLIATNPDLLIEDANDDEYWGCGQDGKGQNRLGKLLMIVRAEMIERTVR